MNIRPLLLCLLWLLPLVVSAQDEDKVYQFSGLIISKTTSEPIPYVRIQVNHTRRGAVSNSEGFYSIPVGLGDTLYLSHLGFHASKLIVGDYMEEYQGDKSQYIYAIHYMLEDTFQTDSVVIFPYDTPEELRTAVVNLDLDVDPLTAIAEDNMDPSTLHLLMETLPVDGGERLMVARQTYFDNYTRKNLLPTVGFDPVAAVQLLQYVVDKAKRRRTKDLNYWEDN
ncbi:carboxypeptidase-like regulatory domain-containing protein [Pontibacter sp. G13]|uniref:carboxypeptidase-like regulatory domain-containing protein n=1 Tax=Pontibacter sp. G13 TaxID=3074898 RepID=UPI00288A756C|nr:carboxypeptidase-like regulatory domain-containing protein [Pontibacter sp. G13]WNJ21089.1 carboxypeptidase-like regulatory domain-containing protein [Pontibacter sp. G13]